MTTTAADRLAIAARDAGVPRDQLTNFLKGGYVPQPKQLHFHAAARECDKADGPTEIGYGGARGPGKSHAVVAQVGLDDCQRRDGLKALYLRKVGKQAREQLEDLRLRVFRHTPHDYKRQQGVIEFENGSRIFLGHFKNESDIDQYLGLEYDVIAVEEATTLTLTKFQALRDSNRTSRDDWRPRMYTSTNPGGVGHAWYKKRFILPAREGSETETRFIFGTVEDNAFVNKEYRANLEKNIGWRLKAYRFGDWDIAAGQFFTVWNHDAHVIEPFNPPLDWYFWLAMDYGFTHWNVVYLMAEDGDGNIYHVAEHAERSWLVSRHAEAVRQMCNRWNVTMFRIQEFVTGADVFAKRGTDGGTIADQWHEEGFDLKPANMDRINGAAEYLKRLGDVEAGIPPTMFIFDTCAGLIECIPSLEHDPHRPEDVLKVDVDDDGNGGDDFYDASRYGIMARAGGRYGRTYAIQY